MISCFECGQPAEHNHHVVPRSQGGTRTVPLCIACHSKVHGRRLQSVEVIRAGIAAKRARGEAWNNGRPKGSAHKATPEVCQAVGRLKQEGQSIAAIARVCKISRPTVYAILAAAE